MLRTYAGKLGGYLQRFGAGGAARGRSDARAQALKKLSRGYDGASFNRLNGDWSAATMSANGEVRHALRNLRGRSRNLARNNEMMKRFIELVINNVVGARGIQLQVKLKGGQTPKADRELSRQIEAAFKEWSFKETATISGRMSFRDAQAYSMRSLVRDGEFLCRHVAARNAFGYSMRFYDPAFLDETHNGILSNGNSVIMGVEVNPAGRPVAYHLTTPYFDYYGNVGRNYRERERVPAEEIEHGFIITEDEEQARGVPWIHAAMQKMRDLHAYEHAEVIAARAEASKMLFLKPPAGDEDAGVSLDAEGQEADAAEGYDLPTTLEPGLITELPPGFTIEDYDPKHPKEAFGFFVKSMLRGVASGLGCSYVSLANDLEGVNYSSIRAGLIEEREMWRTLQGFLIEHFCRGVFRAFLKHAFLSGALGGVTLADLKRAGSGEWQGRGFPWVDPLKDLQSSVVGIRSGLSNYTKELAEQGVDFEEHLEQIAAERAAISAAGLSFDLSTTPPGGKSNAQLQEEKETPGDADA